MAPNPLKRMGIACRNWHFTCSRIGTAIREIANITSSAERRRDMDYILPFLLSLSGNHIV